VLIFFFSIAIAFGVGAAAFVVGVRYRNRLVEPDMRRSWVWPVIPLSVAYTVVALLAMTIALQFVNAAFRELTLPWFYAALLVGIVCGALAYNVANHMMQITVRSVLDLFAIILLGGLPSVLHTETNHCGGSSRSVFWAK
jgi:hypothetical protein